MLENTTVAVPAQVWGAPIIDDDVTFFFNSGLDLGDGSRVYAFGKLLRTRYRRRFFYYRNPDGRGGVFTKGDGSRLIADVNG